MDTRKKIITIATLAIVFLILLYAFFNARLLIEGPRIIIKSPENGSKFDIPLIQIEGEAHNTSFITMNGRQIYVNEEGIFKEKLLLPKGTSIIKFDAKDRFERKTEVTLWYTFKGEQPEIVMPEITEEKTSSSTFDKDFSSSSSEIE